jgi:5-formyltetrahydrofolate cyclo-ligase
MRARRRSIAPAEAAEAARKAAQVAEAWILDHRPDCLALYCALNGEIDPSPLAERLRDYGVELALPAVVARERPLAFRAWRPGAPLVTGFAGIPEPMADAAPVIPDVLVVPLVAFDRRCHRLGSGEGFYDRTLERLSQRGRVATIGLAFAAQEIDEAPVEAHDIPLDAIATERGLILPGA